MKIAVIGASGFVGKAICDEIQSQGEHQLKRIVRGDDWRKEIVGMDIVIHTANPARRFWAEKNPQGDFTEAIEKTYEINKAITANQKFILISSISARTQLYNVYGRHRRACEMIVESRPNVLVVRLGPMYSGGKKEGALYDILSDRPVFVSGETRYSYVPVQYNAKKIIENLNSVGLIELGAKNAISLKELRDQLGSASTFEGVDDTQMPLIAPNDAPDSFEVIAHAKSLQQPAGPPP